MNEVKNLKNLVQGFEVFLNEDAPALAVQAPEITVLPPKEVAPEVEPTEEPGTTETNAYPNMESIEPKSSRAKAAYADKATSGDTSFVFVIEELNGSNPNEFRGRAAIVCTHGGKVVYAASSFPQSGKKAIPTNLYRMIPTRGSSMPSWVKPYLGE